MLLNVDGLEKRFVSGRRWFGRPSEWTNAVEGVSFQMDQGETLALVGESGAGKSTVGRLVLRLLEPDRGTVLFEGVDVLQLGSVALRTVRNRMQMVFQDPFSSLDPRLTIGKSIVEPLRVHFGSGQSLQHRRRAYELIERVGLGLDVVNRYPRELSGGQLQRAAIARALTLKPSLIVCDEPVSALDASVRAQVLNLMMDLQADLGLSYLFITHDLSILEMLADRVIVMRSGSIVEQGSMKQVLSAPSSPYTRGLLDAVPKYQPHRRELVVKGVEDGAPAVDPEA